MGNLESNEKFPKQPSEITIIGESPFSNQNLDIKKNKGSEDSDPYKTSKPDSKSGENTDSTFKDVKTKTNNQKVPFLIDNNGNTKKNNRKKIIPVTDEVDTEVRPKSFAGNLMSAMSSFYQEPEVKEDVTKADTPGFRNKEIEEQEPYYYQHMFHIKNLRKINDLSSFESYKVDSEDLDMINAQMMPFVCNGVLFTVLFNYERATKKIEFEGRTQLRILKHNTNPYENNTPEVVFQIYLQNNNCGIKDVKNAFPGVFNVNKLYFSVVQNNLEICTTKYEVWCYDFESMTDRVVVSKEAPFPKAYQGSDLIPQMGLLSVYVPINENAQYDPSIVLTEEQFLQNTHARYNFRSLEPLNETGKYRGLL